MKAQQRLVIGLLAIGPALAADRIVSFEKDVKPLVEARCVKCHGAAMQLSKLDLRTRDSALKGGEKGPALAPGNAEQSTFYRRVAGLEKPAMPMDGKLAHEEVETLRLWIEQGAKWDEPIGNSVSAPAASEDMEIPAAARQFWAFKRPLRAPIPQVADEAWSRHPVDAFLRKAMAARGLHPAPKADRRTLARRAYLDLTGLPPTPEQTKQFINDGSPDAWDRLIERLLASPQYGERWGRHWLDVARYADSSGYEHDFDRPNAWRYRDYVIRSFNRDTPYNVFLAEQIAGDELDWVTDETMIATGFLRSYAKAGYREKDNPQYRYEYLDDMIATLGRGVMGLTVQCARCHNHKFDPIPQKDYYKLQATLFGYVEVEHPLVSAAETAANQSKIAEVEAKLTPLRQKIREIDRPYRESLLAEKFKKFPANIQEAISVPEAKRTPGQALLATQVIRQTAVSSAEIDRLLRPEELERKKQLVDEIQRVERERPGAIPTAMVVTDGDYRFTPDGPGDEPAPGKGVKRDAIEGSFLFSGPGKYQTPPSYFLHHGDLHSPGSLMKPGFVTVATYGNPSTELPPANGHTSGRRRALAEWLGSPENPLTARVIVNRIWHHHFGRGIVGTLDNLGAAGDRPTHPELLDWLAVEFMRRGWSFKQMHRLLMTSQAYQMASQFEDAEDLKQDPDNLLLWRFRQQRLEAEAVRDSVLAASGSLNSEMFGPPIFPRLAAETLASMKNGIWKQEDDGPNVWRRSVYVYRKRGLPFPMFEVFDLPDQNTTCGRRNVSTVPTQALTLLNNEFILDQAKRFAERVRKLSPTDRGEQLRAAYELALNRPPSEEERRLGEEFLAANPLEDLAHVLFNLNEFIYVR